MSNKSDLNAPATKGDLARIELIIDKIDARMGTLDSKMGRSDGRMDSLDGRMDSLDGRMDSLDGRMDKLDGGMEKLGGRLDKSDSTLETMAQQIDWLYKRELDKEEQSLIHDNRHEEVEDKLVNHEGRIVKVENFVTMVAA